MVEMFSLVIIYINTITNIEYLSFRANFSLNCASIKKSRLLSRAETRYKFSESIMRAHELNDLTGRDIFIVESTV